MEIALYIEGKLYPAVEDLLGAVISELPQVTGVELWNQYTTDPQLPVLVLGNMPPIVPLRYIKTLSQKQILANPTSLTEIVAAINLLLAPPLFAPMKYFTWSTFTFEKLDRLFDRVLVVDIETGGDIETYLPEEMWLLSVAITDGKRIIVLTEEALRDERQRRALARFLLSGRRLIAHNMKFDFRSLSAQLGIDLTGHYDTMLMQHVLNPSTQFEAYNLKKMCIRYLGAPDWDGASKEYVRGKHKLNADGTGPAMPEGYTYPKELMRKYGRNMKVGFEAIPRHLLYEYNAYDVYWTWHLAEYQIRGAAGDPRVAKLAKFEFEMSNFFQQVEKNGVAVDIEYIEGLRVDLVERENQVLEKIRALTGLPAFKPNSPQQVKRVYQDLGHPLKSTAEGILLDLVFKDEEDGSEPKAAIFTRLLLEARGITKLKGTYVEGIQKRLHSGLVYPDFLVHGTSTGRLSSRDPNIQNIPRDSDTEISLRRIFVPRDVETRSLVAVDYSQAELRIMACLSEDEYLISLFQPGMPDFFDSLMPVAFPRVNLEDLDKDTKKNMRANLKGVIYGMSYGRRAAAIAKALGISVKEADTIMRNYFKAAPKLYEWRTWVSEMAVSPEHTLVTKFDRYYQAEVVSGNNKQNVINSGLAFLPQSTASDICVVAAMAVQKWIHEYDAYIIATIHDAILIDCPDEHIEEVERRVQEEMEAAGVAVFGTVVPFATEATHGKSWQGI